MTQLITCDNIKSLLDQWLDNDLSPDERAAYTTHLETCPACRAVCDQARQLQNNLKHLPCPEPAPDFFVRAVSNAIQHHEKTSNTGQRKMINKTWAGAFAGALAASFLIFVINFSGPVNPLLNGNHADNSLAQNSEIPTLHIGLEQTSKVRLVFNAEQTLENSQITLTLPPQTELAGYAGQRQISWQTSLNKGSNLLVLPIKLTSANGGGELTARIEHTGQSEEFHLRLIYEEAHQSRQISPGVQIMT